MRMLLVGAGAVGESILKVMQWRDQKGEWLEYVLVCDYDLKRAEEVVAMMKGDTRFEASKIDATNTEEMAELIREHKIDFVMDAAPPFASNMIFDAAFKTGADYGSMGTWSVPMEDPAYGLGIENSYTAPMTKYKFARHDAWKKQGNMAVICMGIDPGVVNVFAKYAATELLDEITEVHVKDGGNLSVPGADPDDIMFGFNVWTVLDEVMNPNVEYDKEKGGFIVEKGFAGQEVYEMPEGVGKNTLVKVEHEEVVTMARYLSQYGLKKATFKISLDENLITALKVLDKLADAGNTVIVIEHNLDVIKRADYIIDLGPEGGSGGGTIVATGTPEQVAQNPNSFTGQYLKPVLERAWKLQGTAPAPVPEEPGRPAPAEEKAFAQPPRKRKKADKK